jgi:hypothetical protein
MNDELLKRLLLRTASSSIGASTVRNQGAAGVVQAARRGLAKINLERYRGVGADRFSTLLNEDTNKLQRLLPPGARHWGTARKCINIFFRDILYNRFLNDRYSFSSFEPLLELPLDRHVATGLQSAREGKTLPRWTTIKRLTPETSAAYQKAATRIATRLGTHTVHLDLMYWRDPAILRQL